MPSVLAAAGLVVGGLVISTPAAEAATTQRICSSKASAADFYLYLPNGNYHRMHRTDCYTVPLRTVVGMEAGSYRVGYEYGPYSECRIGVRNFIPWQQAKIIYFKTYATSNCSS